MIPNNFGLIKQKEFDLIALNFMNLKLDNFDIEIIPAIYLDGYGYPQNSLEPTAQVFCTALTATFDPSIYKYVIVPIGTEKIAACTSLGNEETISIGGQIFTAGFYNPFTGYVLLNTTPPPNAAVINKIRATLPLNSRLPVFGLVERS